MSSEEMSYEEAIRLMDEEFPGWRQWTKEELREHIDTRMDELLDLYNDLGGKP